MDERMTRWKRCSGRLTFTASSPFRSRWNDGLHHGARYFKSAREVRMQKQKINRSDVGGTEARD